MSLELFNDDALAKAALEAIQQYTAAHQESLKPLTSGPQEADDDDDDGSGGEPFPDVLSGGNEETSSSSWCTEESAPRRPAKPKQQDEGKARRNKTKGKKSGKGKSGKAPSLRSALLAMYWAGYHTGRYRAYHDLD
eukprot:gnl/Spiro4/11686_TR6165_c0_g2_i2.p1 gnl/Spiro4/11686_TR6165_c0_g2~~gnl/Spiro4/11686_TR6165_c0_g2_i2.p1  ORF type:complete len:149 (+),score=41.47 gnl/Spiro4/11686_TR6165_c0_g2_i2:40-447(+)